LAWITHVPNVMAADAATCADLDVQADVMRASWEQLAGARVPAGKELQPP